MAIGPDGNAWQIPPLNFVVINIWWSQSCKHVSTMPTCRCCCSWIKNAAGAIFFTVFNYGGRNEVCGVIWNRIKPKKSCWQSDTTLQWGNEKLVGEMQHFVGEMQQFVGETMQFVGEMKQICWGNEANGWGNEVKCVGETNRQSAYHPWWWWWCLPPRLKRAVSMFGIRIMDTGAWKSKSWIILVIWTMMQTSESGSLWGMRTAA